MFSLPHSIKIRASKDIEFALRKKKKAPYHDHPPIREQHFKFTTCLSLHSLNNVNVIKLHLIFQIF